MQLVNAVLCKRSLDAHFLGILMAMGAGRRAIFTLVLNQGMRQIAMGLALGLP